MMRWHSSRMGLTTVKCKLQTAVQTAPYFIGRKSDLILQIPSFPASFFACCRLKSRSIALKEIPPCLFECVPSPLAGWLLRANCSLFYGSKNKAGAVPASVPLSFSFSFSFPLSPLLRCIRGRRDGRLREFIWRLAYFPYPSLLLMPLSFRSA